MKPKKIFLIRHGQSIGNVNKTIYTEIPDYALHLTDVGKNQAKEAGSILKNTIGSEKLAVYYSPFFRTIQTFNYLTETLGNECLIPTFVKEDPRLREQEWHGTIPSTGFNQDAEDERDAFGTFYFRFDRGESCADVYDRISDFLDTLHRDFEKKDFPDNCLLVTHGMTMRLILMRWFHKTVRDFERWNNPNNCQIVTLTLNDKNKYDFDFDTLDIREPKHEYQCELTVFNNTK